MGVSTFGDSATGEFDRFDNAFVTMFRLTTDGAWPEAAPPFDEDGTVNWRGAAFSMTYIVVVNWVVLQVRQCAVYWPALAACLFLLYMWCLCPSACNKKPKLWESSAIAEEMASLLLFRVLP
jgi:hypothetical protein